MHALSLLTHPAGTDYFCVVSNGGAGCRGEKKHHGTPGRHGASGKDSKQALESFPNKDLGTVADKKAASLQ